MSDDEKDVNASETGESHPKVFHDNVSASEHPSDNPEVTKVETPIVEPTIQPAAVPLETPAVTSTEIATPPQPVSKNTAGVLVLQWLAYAFWGWMAASLWWLTALVIGNTVDPPGNDYGYMSTFIAYSFASTLVLYIISLVTDVIYSRKEPLHKTGAATVIMIIHTVIYSLIGIGAAITAVFALVNMMIGVQSSYDTGNSALTTLLTALVMIVVYGSLIVRILRPLNRAWIPKLFWGIMSVITLGVMAAAVIGPITQTQVTADDRLIETNLPVVSDAISSYAQTNNTLPESLQSLPNLGEANQLVEKNLVEYTPGTQNTTNSTNSTSSTYNGVSTSGDLAQQNDTSYNYKLCVTYTKPSTKSGSYAYYNINDTYDKTTPNVSSHAAGRVCYNLVTALY